MGLSRESLEGEGFAEAPSAAKPLRAGPTVKRSRQETRVFNGASMGIIGAGRAQNGLRMKSRLPIYDPCVWLDSGAGWAFERFSGRIGKSTAPLNSEEVITEEQQAKKPPLCGYPIPVL